MSPFVVGYRIYHRLKNSADGVCYMHFTTCVLRMIKFCHKAATCLLAAHLLFFPAVLPVSEGVRTLALHKEKTTLHDRDFLIDYLRTAWRTPTSLAEEIVDAARDASAAHHLDPALVLAVAARESSFRDAGNPGATGGRVDPFKPHGVMQVSGRHHPEKFPNGRVRMTSVTENVHIGAMVLAEYIARENGDIEKALQRYNGARRDPQRRYAASVFEIRTQFASLSGRAKVAQTRARDPIL